MLYEFLKTELLPSLAREVVDIRARMAIGDMESVRKIAHRIKGSALSFGMVDVDRITRALMLTDSISMARTLVEELSLVMARSSFVSDPTAHL